jgi:signal transduction histidine kinase
LGLSIARWIAEAHDGTIELVRSDQTGTTFAITLPLK